MKCKDIADHIGKKYTRWSCSEINFSAMACCSRFSSVFRSCLQSIHLSKVQPRVLATCYPTISHKQKTAQYATKAKIPAGAPKPKPIPGYRVAVTKGFDSQHTGSIKGSHGASDRLLDDIMIRKYLSGVFYDHICSDVIIKRRDNRIIIAFLIRRETELNKFYFLTAMSEKLLSAVFGCIVTFEPQAEGP